MLSTVRSSLSRITSGGIFSTTVFSLVLRVSGLGITLLTTLVLTNLLSVGEYGVYVYILSTANLVVLLVVMGCDTLLLRQAVVYVKAKKSALFRGIQLYVLVFVVSMTIVFCIILSFALPILGSRVDEAYAELFWLFILLVPLGAGIRVFEGFTRGLRAPLAAQVPDQLVRRLLFLGALVLIWATGQFENTAYNAMVFQVLAAMIALVVASVICIWNSPVLEKSHQPRFQFAFKFWIVASFTLAGTTILQTIVSQLPIVLLGFLSTPESVAQYSVAIRVGSLLNLFIIASNMSIAGHVAEYNENQDIDKLAATANKSARTSFLMALPVGFLIFAFAEPVLSVFGDEYSESTFLLRFVVVGYLIHVGSGAAAVFLNMTYNEKFTLYVSITMFVFSIILSYFMILWNGASGAVMAYMTSFLIYKFIIVSIVWIKVGLDTSILGIVKPR